jgi:AraC family transcriptional regulator, arabinose operon regulatory protein
MSGTWLLTYTISGGCQYRVGGPQVTAAAGDVDLMRCAAPIERSVPGPDVYEWHYVRFDPWPGWSPPAPLVRSAAGHYRAHATLLHTRQRVEDAFRRLIADTRARDTARQLAKLGERTGRRGDAAIAAHRDLALAAIGEILLRIKGDTLETARLDPRIVATLQIVAADLAAPHDASTLAKAAGLSKSRFMHLLREQLGMPLRNTIRTLRLQQAAVMLAYEEESIGAVAERVGFSSIYVFSREFRLAYGMSPRAYRAQSRTPLIPAATGPSRAPDLRRTHAHKNAHGPQPRTR